MSSVAGTEISWSRKATKPLDIFHDPAGYVEDTVYDNLYKQFNPQKFDAKAWVALAKKAGMKYLVFTAKHHGGFCMWDTKYTDYNIMHTAFRRDVVKELADACHAAGLGFGIYYSPRDWHHPDYGIGDNQKYVDYMNGQLTELLTHYGKVDILWFDSYGFGKGINEAFWQITKTYNLIKKLQPDILINNRLQVIGDENATYKGDWDTPEQQLGEFQNTRPWESCLTLVKTPDGGGWSYRKDGTLRSYRECINALLGCATGDGNLLLDAGPDATGVIPADQSARLIEMGTWLHKYGASIYGTRGGPFGNGEWGGATYKGNTVYLHITKFNGNTLTLPPLKSAITSWANLTNRNNKPTITQTAQGITITLDASKQDAYDTIIEVTLAESADKEDIPITVAK
jgi:alpha-L-fucosidase